MSADAMWSHIHCLARRRMTKIRCDTSPPAARPGAPVHLYGGHELTGQPDVSERLRLPAPVLAPFDLHARPVVGARVVHPLSHVPEHSIRFSSTGHLGTAIARTNTRPPIVQLNKSVAPAGRKSAPSRLAGRSRRGYRSADEERMRLRSGRTTEADDVRDHVDAERRLDDRERCCAAERSKLRPTSTLSS